MIFPTLLLALCWSNISQSNAVSQSPCMRKYVWRSRRTLDKTVPPRTSVHVSYLRSPRMELLIANERAVQR